MPSAAEEAAFAAARRGSEPARALATFLLSLRSRGLRNHALHKAIEQAPREAFLPAYLAEYAYAPHALPLPCGQQATAPLTVVSAIQALQLARTHHLLEIGTGSGFQTALLAQLCAGVTSIERYRTLAGAASAALEALGIVRAVVVQADATQEDLGSEVFDRIIVNAAMTAVPEKLQRALAPDGWLLAPIQQGGHQRLTLFKSLDGQLLPTDLGSARFPPLSSGVVLAL